MIALKRLLYGLAALFEFFAAVGVATFAVGSLEVGLIAAGLFCYFLGEFA